MKEPDARLKVEIPVGESSPARIKARRQILRRRVGQRVDPATVGVYVKVTTLTALFKTNNVTHLVSGLSEPDRVFLSMSVGPKRLTPDDAN